MVNTSPATLVPAAPVAVAMKQGTTTASFSIKKGKKIEVIGENRTITVKKGNFSDDFSNCAVHLYKIIK